VEIGGSWIPVFWVAVACDLLAALLALFWLKPLVAHAMARHAVGVPQVAGAEKALIS
jgi:hypothetical protein